MEKNIRQEVFSYKDGVMSSSHVSAEKFNDGSIDIYLPKNGEYEYVGMFDSLSLDDVAKLSHSVCGSYDFFNNALFDVRIGEDFSPELELPFENARYINIFRRKLEESGFDYLSVRIYEVSLFLSMLPLHMDNPLKVLAFILNAKKILEEIEKDV